MSGDDHLTLHLTPAGVEAYCGRLAAQLTDHQRRLAALTSLSTFIATFTDAGGQSGEAYREVRAIIERHAEQARAALLAQNAAALGEALATRNVAAVAGLYRPLSRSGFQEVLERTAMLQPAALAAWCRQWLAEARRRGEEASGYPDAIDFHKAGIDVAEFTAMEDLNRFLVRRGTAGGR